MRAQQDEALVLAAQNGDRRAEEEILTRYKGQVRFRAKAYYILGADKEDVVQEGMIGLFKAIQGYDPACGAAFATYASVCIDRQIQDAIRAASRKKHEPLNMSLSLDEEGAGWHDGTGLQGGHGAVPGEEAETAGFPAADDLLARMQGDWKNRFSELERYVFEGRLVGKTVQQMATEQGCEPKAIYNAAERMKKKIRKMAEECGMLH